MNEDNKDLNEGNKKEENVKAFTEFLEKASSQDSSQEKVKLDSEQQKPKIDKSLFKDFLIMDLMAFQLIQTIKCWHY